MDKGYIKDVCAKAFSGLAAGGIFGVSLFSNSEVEEIENLKKLSVSIISKSPDFMTDRFICEEIIKDSKTDLQTFINNAPSEKYLLLAQ